MAESSGAARLFVLAGPDLARSFPLGERTTLGRSDECDVVLRDRSISRRHAVLVRTGESWFLQDLGSTNGVSKDGKRGERFELRDGDEFKLGDLPLRIRLHVEPQVQDIEFDLGSAAAASAPEHAPATSPEPRAAAAPGPSAAGAQKGVAEEIEIEIGGPAPAASAPAAPLEATAFRAPRAARRTGFLAGDLEQRPFWLRALLFLAVLAVSAGLAYGAFRAVQMLRAGL